MLGPLAAAELGRGTTSRSEKMEPDQDWTSVYPTAASFKPSAVPLPIRMGYPVKGGVALAKEGNLELLKAEGMSVDYRHDIEALIDSQRLDLHPEQREFSSDQEGTWRFDSVKLSSLNLDDHARKKFIKLVGERYCGNTDTKMEPWEKEITEADMLEYVWENSVSEKSALKTLLQIRAAEKAEEMSREELLASEVMQDYKKSVVLLKNEGETEKNLLAYKNSVKRLLNIQGL
ncbi:28S ribosomal protein S35, mitochondrial, partial [Ophiophagus hannah]